MTYVEEMNRRRDYEHSRPLEVHRCSDHPEVNAFVNRIYKEHIHKSGTNIQIKKKHLKVVLLDLYVAWSDDPSLNIAVYMSRNAYPVETIQFADMAPHATKKHEEDQCFDGIIHNAFKTYKSGWGF